MIGEMIQSALKYHKSGQYEGALKLYQDILAVEPNNIDVLYLIGVLNYERNNYDDAMIYTLKVIKLNPSSPDAYCSLANILKAKGELDAAIEYYKKSLIFDNDNSTTHYNLGVAYQDIGNLDSALLCYKKAIDIKRDFAEAYNNLGNVHRDKDQLSEAIFCYRKAIEFKSGFAEAFNNLGAALKNQGHMEEARICYEKALQLNPDYAAAYNNLGNILRELNQYNDALICYQKALHIDPDIAEAYYSIGIIAYRSDRIDESIAYTRKALEIDPMHIDSYSNLGVALQDILKSEEAMSSYRKAISIDPNFAEAHWNLSLSLLLLGKWREGFREYEWRRYVEGILIPRNITEPVWDGTELGGKTIMILTEQGYGDAIQFIRYMPLIVTKGGIVIIECQRELAELFENVPGVSKVVRRGDTLPPFDVHSQLLSMPYLFGTEISSIPSQIPYIKADTRLVSYWHERMRDDKAKMKIGLTWAGVNPKKKNFPLNLLAPIMKANDVTFYSLQKGEPAQECMNARERFRIIDWTCDIDNFAHTAALIENMDLTITADTAVAHLAGAMGKPVWTLLPYAADWRWLLGREDSPWYPTMRLFRQPALGDWESVIARVAESLAEYTAS